MQYIRSIPPGGFSLWTSYCFCFVWFELTCFNSVAGGAVFHQATRSTFFVFSLNAHNIGIGSDPSLASVPVLWSGPVLGYALSLPGLGPSTSLWALQPVSPRTPLTRHWNSGEEKWNSCKSTSFYQTPQTGLPKHFFFTFRLNCAFLLYLNRGLRKSNLAVSS